MSLRGYLTSAGARLRERPRVEFALRLVLSFAAVLVLAEIGVHWQQTRLMRGLLLEQGVLEHEGHAQLIERAGWRRIEGERRWGDVREILGAILAEPGVEQAQVLDARGVVVVSTRLAEEGGTDTVDAAVLQHGRTVSARREGEGGATYEYTVALDLPGERFVLEVRERAAEREAPLRALAGSARTLLMVSVVLALPLLYLLSGRSLAARYDLAVQRSTLDGLTGLGNHRAFQEELQRELSRATRHRGPTSLLLLDVDDFKVVNDSEGHRRGDELLVSMGAVLGEGRAQDRAFRIGGDEFALLLPQTALDDARAVAERILHAAVRKLGGVTVSIGLAQITDETPEPDVLVDQADAALYEAKRRGRDTVATYAELEGGAPVLLPTKAQAVRRLLAEQDVHAVFQPIWNLARDRVLGYEALVRPALHHGLTGPLEAFEIAERLGHVVELDALCRRIVLARAGEIAPDTLLFVNLSPDVLDHRASGAEDLADEVRAAGLDPRQVVLEITARATPQTPFMAAEASRLRELGFRIALDNAGTGKAGLDTLRHLVVDFLKIDPRVVADAHVGGPGRAIVAALLAFAEQAQAQVIANGVETVDILEFVRRLSAAGSRPRVHGLQGFLLGHPVERIPSEVPAR